MEAVTVEQRRHTEGMIQEHKFGGLLLLDDRDDAPRPLMPVPFARTVPT
jgi:hypothetical protein